MPPVYQIGRLERVYVAKQSAFRTKPTFASADALRHTNCQINISNNRMDSPERFLDPSLRSKFTRRKTGNFTLAGLLYPSGTLNTLPDTDEIFECGLGSKRNTTLSTTIASGPTTTGCTLTSAAGLAVGDPILINVTTGTPATGRVIRWLLTVAGAVVTWDPPLPQAPAVADTVKGCVGYNLATALPNALEIGQYFTSISKEADGAVIDQLKLTFDANNEVMWSASGPIADRLTAAQSIPGAFTTVGSQAPPSGLVGYMRVGTAAVDFLKAEITVQNTMEMDNFVFGTSTAQNYFRKNQRKITAAITAILSDSTTLMTAAETATDSNATAWQCGQTEGNIVAVYGPNLDFDVPDMPDGEETLEITFNAAMKGISGNDEMRLAIA
jgi:hypothetical protein